MKGYWIGPMQINSPKRGVKSMDETDKVLSCIYGAITLGLTVCAYGLGGGIFWFAPVLSLLLLLNRLGLWCL